MTKSHENPEKQPRAIESPDEGFVDFKTIDHIITARGSKYVFLEDGRAQRHKTVERRDYEVQDLLVFTPPRMSG